jgi:NADH:ubiquinone oxidoreductase subunit C
MTTTVIPGTDVAERINDAFPGAVLEATQHSVTVRSEAVADVALFLRDDDDLDCKYLNTLLGIDWVEHFDIVYVLSSLARNHTLVLEARTFAHEDPVVPSVSGVWQGANLQEREVYDLMGIAFSGHPNLRRIFLWEGFPGHPLRKDFLALPEGHKPGLQRFPYEFPAGQRSYPNLGAEDGPRAPAVPRLVGPLPGQLAAQDWAGGQLGTRGGGSQDVRSPETRLPHTPGNPPAGETAEGGSTPAVDEPSAEATTPLDAGGGDQPQTPDAANETPTEDGEDEA